jgi:hypothetical protein
MPLFLIAVPHNKIHTRTLYGYSSMEEPTTTVKGYKHLFSVITAPEPRITTSGKPEHPHGRSTDTVAARGMLIIT